MEQGRGGVQRWHDLKKVGKKEKKEKKNKEKNKERKEERGEKKKKMAPAGFSKSEGEQNDGTQPPSRESMPTDPCPSDQHFKIRKRVSHIKSGCFS